MGLEDTRDSYDRVAADYARSARPKAIDCEHLAAFAALVAGPVLDVGCGPGHATAHLAGLGLDARGLDLSTGMVEVARASYPDLRFEVGDMAELDVADGALGGILSFYSIIHTEPALLPAILVEFRRALAAGGHLLLAFQVGDEKLHIERGYGQRVSLDTWRWRPEAVGRLLGNAGFTMVSTTVREPDPNEKVPQAYLVARV